MAKPPPDPHADVLVLGSHPAAYLAGALLRHKSVKCRVLHATLPDEPAGDRLVLVNPALFELHSLLAPLRRKLDLAGIYGVRFLADDPATASEFRSKSAAGCVAQLKDLRSAMQEIAGDQGVELLSPKSVRIRRVDEHALHVTLGQHEYRPKALILAARLAGDQERMLGLTDDWEAGILHRYTFVRVKGTKILELGSRPVVPMSLDLGGRLAWAWLLPCEKHFQLAVEQPLDTVSRDNPLELLKHWAGVLERHGIFKSPLAIEEGDVESLNLPFAGALAHEGVANRTLLIGPAGGFYSATGEDVYPNCWSALYAAEVMKKSLKEPHLQDAIQAYRQRWRTTLGDYLRGPQMDLRFLLPLVYRNQEMTNRLAEAILAGRSIVR